MTGLVDEPRDASPDLARLWERHDVQAAPMLTKTFRHPAVGEVTVDCNTLTLTDRDQYLVLFGAPPGSPDAEALAPAERPGSRGQSLPAVAAQQATASTIADRETC